MNTPDLNESIKKIDEPEELNKKIIGLISENTIFDEQVLWEIFIRVRSFDKLFCIINMSVKFHMDLQSAEYDICGWMGIKK